MPISLLRCSVGSGGRGPESGRGAIAPYANAGGQASERGKPPYAAANCPTGSPCKHLQSLPATAILRRVTSYGKSNVMRKALKLATSISTRKPSTAKPAAAAPAKPASVAKLAPATTVKPAANKLSAVAATAATVKPATDAAPVKHDISKLTYTGPSPVIRGHGRKLTAINPAKTFGPATERDNSYLRDLRAAYGNKPFLRLDSDAGCVNRQLFYGNVVVVGGDLAARNLQLQITPTGMQRKL